MKVCSAGKRSIKPAPLSIITAPIGQVRPSACEVFLSLNFFAFILVALLHQIVQAKSILEKYTTIILIPTQKYYLRGFIKISSTRIRS